MKRTLSLGLVLSLCGCLLSGCALHRAAETMGTLPQTLGKSAAAATQMIIDQGVLDTFVMNAEGDFINPGIEITSAFQIVTQARLIGVTGSIESGVQGTGTQLPKDVRAALIAQLDMPISDEQRAGILQALGWNRVESPHNPTP